MHTTAHQRHLSDTGRQAGGPMRSRVVRKTRYGFQPEPLNLSINPETRHLKTEANESLNSERRNTLDPRQSESKSFAPVAAEVKIDKQKLSTFVVDKDSRILPVMARSVNATIDSSVGFSEKNHKHRALDAIEKRMDQLLREKLKALMESKRANMSQQDKRSCQERVARLNSELKELVADIKDSSEVDGDPSILKRWRMLDSKLQLLDKTLAESKTELEIMKGYYSVFANNRTAYKQMSHPIKLSSAERSNMHFNRSLDSNSVHTRYAVPMSSMTKQTYEAPQKEDYEKYRYRQPAYERHLRPLPSSSYQQSFQDFSGLKLNDRFSQQDEFTKLGPFQPEYHKKNNEVPHPAERVNYRQLDCFLDKFKSLKVSYGMREVKPVNPGTSLQFARMEKEINMVHKLSDRRAESLHQQIRSIANSSYKPLEEDAKEMFRNEPKNNRLQHFANDFRHLVKL